MGWVTEEGGEDVLRKHRVMMPGYAYAFHPWLGYYPYFTWQEYELEY